MKVNELLKICDDIAPFADSESWDNTGLLVGDEDADVTKVLTTLDCAPETIDEAVKQGANTIIAHHPLIFKGLDKITEGYIGSVVRQLIKNDINLIVMHTNLDHQPDGVSHMIAENLGFSDTEILVPQKGKYKKLRVNITPEDKDGLKRHLGANGAGHLGDYSECFFEYPGTGQFRPNEDADPHIGSGGNLEYVEEYILEAIFKQSDEQQVVQALHDGHPYEEPAYDIVPLDNDAHTGLGVKFDYDGGLDDFVQLIEEQTGLTTVNVVKGDDRPLKKAAIIGGSGMSYADAAFAGGADVLITGDVKYHEAYDARRQGRNIIDAGHYIEVLMADGLQRLLSGKVDVEVNATQVNTNPFQ